jgi:methylated-DNA-[protein]-cysteine S-methyltransferase
MPCSYIHKIAKKGGLILQSVFYYRYPIGMLGIAEADGAICRVFFGEGAPVGFAVAETPLIQKAGAQLAEYFGGKRKAFDLPLALHGTAFQLSVWEALQTIPFGETRCYADIAAMVGNPQASRAVGMANNRNPIAIVVPCHRIIGKSGSLIGYAGGLAIKEYLLGLEKKSTLPLTA